MTKQADKYHLGMAGEFFVAAELQRRGVAASVTYGNAKRADVVVISDGRAIAIEVKTTRRRKWVVGNSLPPKSNIPWVFVRFPPEPAPPDYFILLQSKLLAILEPEDTAYRARYKARHGKDFSGQGVISLSADKADKYKDKWDSILKQVHPS